MDIRDLSSIFSIEAYTYTHEKHKSSKIIFKSICNMKKRKGKNDGNLSKKGVLVDKYHRRQGLRGNILE